nr:uncharacterized protein LOC109155132 isoform X1 [Ipomoea trifida]
MSNVILKVSARADDEASVLSCAVPMAAKAGDALLLEPSTPERVSGFSSPVPVAVSGLQHDIQEYNEG